MTDNLGMVGKQFHTCPQTPNCVSTMANPKDEEHFIAPLAYTGSREKAQARLETLLQELPRQKLIKKQSDYWHYEFRSAMMKFVDNVEFYFPEREKVIHMRSASELGYSDHGVNRKRLTAIQKAFLKVTGTSPSTEGL